MHLNLKIMKSENDWYLVRVEKLDYRNTGNLYFIATYSNGLIEEKKFYAIGDNIKTVISNEFFVI